MHFVDNNCIKIFLFLFAILTGKSFAQKSNEKTNIFKVYAHYGFIMQHRNTMGHLVKGHIYGAEFNWALPSYGRSCFERENNFPERGVGLYCFDLANPEQLGVLVGLAPYYEIPLNYKESRLRNYLRLSMGLSYSNKYFDPITNHKNNVLSTPINGFVNVKWLMKYEFSKKIRIDYGISLSHASNGKTKLPNLGINLATLNLALVFRHIPKPIQIVDFSDCIDSTSFCKSKYEFYLNAAYGYPTNYSIGSDNYLAQTYILGFYKNVRNTHKFGIGLDVFYNPANKINIYQEDSVVISDIENIQLGIKFGWTYNIGKLSLPIEMGYYLRSAYASDGPVYHRIGIRYYFKNNIFASMTLKSHWARADFFEYGIGYRFPVKKLN